MQRRGMFVLLAVALSLTFFVPILAAAPAEGLVVEGQSVPGIALGSSRAEVEDAYGKPESCQSGSVGGDYTLCAYQVDGGGKVWVRYRGADGGGPSNSPDDVAYHIQWEEQVSGWETTAGINTAVARANPEAVIAAYPNGLVTYNQWGNILKVIDYEVGIEVHWWYDFYSPLTSVGMAIFYPSTPPPPPEQVIRVARIDLMANKTKGQRLVTAFVKVEDQGWQAASGATVSAAWSFPDGSRLAVEGITSSSGLARFEVRNAKPGTYALIVDNVVLGGYRFDRDSSTLNASIRVK